MTRVEDEIELRERLSRLESKMDFIVKSVSDHLSRWDRQWTEIDKTKERLHVVEIEKDIWIKVIGPIFGLLGGVVASIMTYVIISRLK